MADTPDSDPDNKVQLTPEAPKAEPKLAAVRPPPKAVSVKVPVATPIRKDADADLGNNTAKGSELTDIIKKGVLLDEVVAATGVKRSDAKLVSEALFAALAAHLQDDKALQLPPLGKLRVVKSKDVGKGGKALTVKIRTPNTE